MKAFPLSSQRGEERGGAGGETEGRQRKGERDFFIVCYLMKGFISLENFLPCFNVSLRSEQSSWNREWLWGLTKSEYRVLIKILNEKSFPLATILSVFVFSVSNKESIRNLLWKPGYILVFSWKKRSIVLGIICHYCSIKKEKPTDISFST